MNEPTKPTGEPKATPQQPTGTIPIAGKNVPINQGSVAVANEGSSSSDLIKGLEEAIDKGIFTPQNDRDEQFCK